jgi:hypothetical protein
MATKTTFALDAESTYDCEDRRWSVPLNFTVSQPTSPSASQGACDTGSTAPRTGLTAWGFGPL